MQALVLYIENQADHVQQPRFGSVAPQNTKVNDKLFEPTMLERFCKRAREISLSLNDPDERPHKRPRLEGAFNLTFTLDSSVADSVVGPESMATQYLPNYPQEAQAYSAEDDKLHLIGWVRIDYQDTNPTPNADPGSVGNKIYTKELQPIGETERDYLRDYVFPDEDEADEEMDADDDSSSSYDEDLFEVFDDTDDFEDPDGMIVD